MAKNTYILNSKQSAGGIFIGGGSSSVQLMGFDEMQKTLTKMTRDDVKDMVKIIRREVKPLVREMKRNAPRSDKRATTTKHRHFSKGQFTTIDRKHKPGELRRSIGVIRSRRYRKHPVMYVGARKGPNQANDGWYAFLVEFGTKNQTANPFFAKSMDARMGQVKRSMLDEFKKHFGHKWEGAKA